MKEVIEKRRRWRRRKVHIRTKIRGTATRPRITVYKSNRFTYVQIIDDDTGSTLVAASNREEANRGIANRTIDLEKLGAVAGERLKAKNITQGVFDRNGYPYHGRLRAVAEGIRKAGIVF